MSPHDAEVARSARQRASLIARLAHHLPRGELLRQLSMGLVVGKLSHALAAVASPRLREDDQSQNASYKAVQVAINDVARTLTGVKRSDHIPVKDLLNKAGLPSVNRLVVKAVAMEAWKAYASTDGGGGSRKPIGSMMFDCNIETRPTRSTEAGLVKVPLRGCNTFITHAATVWNNSEDLRVAKTSSAAKRVAKDIAKKAPL